MAVAEARAPPEALAEATRHQPRAGATLGAALAAGPEPRLPLPRARRARARRAAARAFAAELLADGAPDPDDARRRALIDPSPHPDLVWLRPPGAQHLVDEVRESVIRAASLRPAEGERRVFVIEEAEALRDESQNALLKTLEEPAPFAHLILLCSEPELLAGTILSRCRPVEFAPLAPEAVLEALGGERRRRPRRPRRLSGGDVELARLLLTERGPRAARERRERGRARAARATRSERALARAARDRRGGRRARPAPPRRSGCWRQAERAAGAAARGS